MAEFFYGYNFLSEYKVAHDLKQNVENAERDRRLDGIESMGEHVNVYDARLMAKLFGPKSLEDISDMF
jgi:hypothetical protein